jgi:hypothetical protein
MRLVGLRLVGLGLVGLGLIAGCGAPSTGPAAATTSTASIAPNAAASTPAADTDPVPITERAIAAIMLKYLPQNTTTRTAVYINERNQKGTIGALLRYGGDGESDGRPFEVTLAPGKYTYRKPGITSAKLDTSVPGAALFLQWEKVKPEEDPGYVRVVLQRKDEFATLFLSGPKITADPRTLDLPLTIKQMVTLIEDPQLRLKTTPAAIEAGRSLEGWESP